jgi:hypothetical protein
LKTADGHQPDGKNGHGDQQLDPGKPGIIESYACS